MLFGECSRGRELVVFSFRLFADIHRTRVGEKEEDRYERDVNSRDHPKDQQNHQKEKRCDERAARIFLDYFNFVCDALFDFFDDRHFTNSP